MIKFKMYFSERGIPLVYMGSSHERPVLTVENYCKWYGMYLVFPNGVVTAVDSGEITEAIDNDYNAYQIDHIFSPRVMQRVAEQLQAEICEQSLEMVTGRWMLESNWAEDAAIKLHLFYPDDERTIAHAENIAITKVHKTRCNSKAMGGKRLDPPHLSLVWSHVVDAVKYLPSDASDDTLALVADSYIFKFTQSDGWQVDTEKTNLFHGRKTRDIMADPIAESSDVQVTLRQKP